MVATRIGRQERRRPPEERDEEERGRRRRPFFFALFGALLACTVAYAGSNWVVGLGSGSAGQARSATVANVTIDPVASPAPGTLLYPGSTGDVVVVITNPNRFPVTITAVQLPTDSTFATGYTSSALSTIRAGCDNSTPSGVTWNFASATPGSSHVLATPLTVAANGQADDPLTVTFTDAAAMAVDAPAACEDTFFKLPPMAAISATGGAATVTASPVTDAWTS